mgnify:CR=1 FL=1
MTPVLETFLAQSAPAQSPFGDADAEPVSGSRRALRVGVGRGKPRARKSSGRGDRGGRRVVGLKIGASQLAAAVVQQGDGRPELGAMAAATADRVYTLTANGLRLTSSMVTEHTEKHRRHREPPDIARFDFLSVLSVSRRALCDLLLTQ